MTAIGADEMLNSTLDGQDVWAAINDPDETTYDELLLVIDNQRNLSALIMDKDNTTWKLSQGSNKNPLLLSKTENNEFIKNYIFTIIWVVLIFMSQLEMMNLCKF